MLICTPVVDGCTCNDVIVGSYAGEDSDAAVRSHRLKTVKLFLALFGVAMVIGVMFFVLAIGVMRVPPSVEAQLSVRRQFSDTTPVAMNSTMNVTQMA